MLPLVRTMLLAVQVQAAAASTPLIENLAKLHHPNQHHDPARANATSIRACLLNPRFQSRGGDQFPSRKRRGSTRTERSATGASRSLLGSNITIPMHPSVTALARDAHRSLRRGTQAMPMV
jgi:hypothetical protein